MGLADQRRQQFIAWMRATGVNARQIAVAAELPYTTINSYERGQTRSLSGETEARIAAAMDEPVEALFGLAKPHPNHLRLWRERRGLTREQAATAIGSAPPVIDLLESGDYLVSDKWLAKLAPVYRTGAGLLRLHPDAVSDELLESFGLSEADRSTVRRVIDSLAGRTGTSG